ncbi:MAG: penicillin-binding protein 2 [Agarilytica sp.]
MKFALQMSKWRFYLVLTFLSVLPLALAWHLANLQVIPREDKDFRFLQNAGEARTLRNEKLSAYRGVITDRNGELLAVSTPVKSVFINPQKVRQDQVPAIANAVGMKAKRLSSKLERYENKQFMYLVRHLPPQEANKILAKKFQGVYAQEEFRRYYPAGEVAAHVVGFTDTDDRGREGVELGFNQYLAGEAGSKRVIKDLKGNVVKDLGLVKSPKSGSDLQLTIDLRLQYLAYKELKHAIANQNAKSGSLVMMDANSGEILAMVNQPSYNPNNRNTVKADQLRNRAFTDVFEPGSTMKPFAMMAALESGRYSPHSKIDTSPGHMFVGGKMIPDPVNYGVLDLGKIISKSSQVGISKIALDMDPNDIRDVYFRAGIGQSSGAGFPGESVGELPSRAKWHPVEQATFAYGYGLSVNAVQLAQAYTVIASGGKLLPASLIKQDAENLSTQVIDKKIAKQVTKMLKGVLESGGTAASSQIDAYPVAGKTGTAHKVRAQGYADDRYIALFAGFAPADNPEVVAVVIVNEPPSEGAYSGGKVAAPLFSSVVEKALRVLNVAPKQNKSAKKILAESLASRNAGVLAERGGI